MTLPKFLIIQRLAPALLAIITVAAHFPNISAVAQDAAKKASEQKKLPVAASQQKSNQHSPPQKYVSTSKDADYAFVGEFAGEILFGDAKKNSARKKSAGRNGDNDSKKPAPKKVLALQVRATGNNSFEAIHYWGGLPGVRGHMADSSSYIGQRLDESLILSGGQWAIFVKKSQCLVVDRNGKKLGVLKRVRRVSPTLGAIPPKGAVILFDGSDTDQFTDAEMTRSGLLKEGADMKPLVQDFNLHFEFNLPFMPTSLDQARGNSGCYIHSRYEMQILDSFATPPVFNGIGALYRTRSPDLNMCLPPLVWQTYDIRFTAARWDVEGTKVRHARITAWVNGVKVQDDVELENKTGAGQEEAAMLLPTRLQNHGDPVRFRNIWMVDRGIDNASRFPVNGPKPAAAKPRPAAKPEKRNVSDTSFDQGKQRQPSRQPQRLRAAQS